MKNKIVKIIITLIIGNVFLDTVNNIIFNRISPEILNEAIEKMKEDSSIESEIGKVDDYKYTFDDANYYKDLPTKFELTLFGEKRKMTLKGTLRRTKEKWIIMETDTLFTNYSK